VSWRIKINETGEDVLFGCVLGEFVAGKIIKEKKARIYLE
jgi:hypothetical protein